MIRKLRIKLIIASMVSLFTVLLIVMGTISLLNYRGVIEDADQILGILAENDGSFPDIPGAGERPPENDPRKKERLLSPELPYESRYFSVFLNQSGQPIATNYRKNQGRGYLHRHRLCPKHLGKRTYQRFFGQLPVRGLYGSG